MWEDIDDSQATKADTLWIAEGLKAWTTEGHTIGNKRQTYQTWSGSYFAKKMSLRLTGSVTANIVWSVKLVLHM
jgi:hypothetical protein